MVAKVEPAPDSEHSENESSTTQMGSEASILSGGDDDEIVRVVRPVLLAFEVDSHHTLMSVIFGNRGVALAFKVLSTTGSMTAMLIGWVVGAVFMIASLHNTEDSYGDYFTVLSVIGPVFCSSYMNPHLMRRSWGRFETKYIWFNAIGLYVGVVFTQQRVGVTVAWLSVLINIFVCIFYDAVPTVMRRLTYPFCVSAGCALLALVPVLYMAGFATYDAENRFLPIAPGVGFDMLSRLISFSTNAAVYILRNLVCFFRDSHNLSTIQSKLYSSRVSRKEYNNLVAASRIMRQAEMTAAAIRAKVAPRRNFSLVRIKARVSIGRGTGAGGDPASVAPAVSVLAPRQLHGHPRNSGGGPTPRPNRHAMTLVCVMEPFVVDTRNTIAKRLVSKAYSDFWFQVLMRPAPAVIVNIWHLAGVCVYILSLFEGYAHLWLFVSLSTIPTIGILNLCNWPLLKRLLSTFEMWYVLSTAFLLVCCVSAVATEPGNAITTVSMFVWILGAVCADSLPSALLHRSRTGIVVSQLAASGTYTIGTYFRALASQREVVVNVAGFDINVVDVSAGMGFTLFIFLLKNFVNGVMSPNCFVMLKAPVRSIKCSAHEVQEALAKTEAVQARPSINLLKRIKLPK